MYASRFHPPLPSLVLLFACGPGSLGEAADEAGSSTSSTDDSGSSGSSGTDTTDKTKETDMIDAEHLAEIEHIPDDLQAIVDGAIAYFESEPAPGLPHVCPHPGGVPTGGEASITPSPSTECSQGPEGRCIPTMGGGGGAGHYPSELWTENPVWAGVGFAKTEPHCFHYNFIGVNDTAGFGACAFTAQAFADLDADYIFSTYELRGTVDENGSLIEALFVDLPYD
ncbi:hypothetical protein ACNOYE_31615 [Nannocystaceae bacterium ST9]